MKEILIDFEPDGSYKIEASGFEGRECKEMTKPFEDALGVTTNVVDKPEYKRARTLKRGRTSAR